MPTDPVVAIARRELDQVERIIALADTQLHVHPQSPRQAYVRWLLEDCEERVDALLSCMRNRPEFRLIAGGGANG